MSNEEIVVRIQSGEQELVAELWEQVEKLAAWKARRVVNAIDGKCGVAFDDLYNSGYLAMVAAIETYKPESCAFTTWLMYYLKTAFSEATGFRTQKSKNDALRNAVSLSSPLGDEDDACELMDLIQDPASKAAMETAEERIWQEQLRRALEEALGEIPDDQSAILRCRYYGGKTLAAAGQEFGMPPEEVRKLEHKGLKALRQPQRAKRIRPFFEFDFFSGTGLTPFKHSGMSIQERYLNRCEQL